MIKTPVPKAKMPTGKDAPMAKTDPIKLPTTGVKGFLAQSGSKMFGKMKSPKKGSPQLN